MKKIVHFGARNVGRGFLGQLYYESGFETVFIEVNQEIVDLLNKYHEYPLKIVTCDKTQEIIVKNVRAVNGLELDKVAQEISYAYFLSTAVGVKVLPKIAKQAMLKEIRKEREPLKDKILVTRGITVTTF